MKAFLSYCCILACTIYISTGIVPTKVPLWKNNEEKFIDSCFIEADLTQEEGYEIGEILNETYEQPGMKEKRRKHGCLIECLLKKLEWMEGSEIKEERIYGNITKLLANYHTAQEKTQQLTHDCVQQVRDTTEEECEKGFTVLTCFIKNIQNWKHVIESLFLLEEKEKESK
ncbi:ObpNew [Eciton burchellii]|nr:ObpNew [Eciton burchellii]